MASIYDVSMFFNTEAQRIAAAPFSVDFTHALAYVAETNKYYRLYNPLTGGWASASVDTAAASGFFRPEAFGAVGNGIADDTIPMIDFLTQAGTDPVTLDLTPGKIYAVSASLVFSSVFNIINFNGAKIRAFFGTNYSLPLFTNDRVSSCKIVMNTPNILGNCQFVNLGFNADSPGAGLSLAVYDLYMNTLDGNRRAGTSIFKLRQVDFVSISRGEAWNTDLGFDIGDAANYRECTQIFIDNYGCNQTNATMKLQGVSKATISGIDALKTCAGFSLEGRVELVTFNHCHVEGLSMSGFQTPSDRVSSNSTGIGYNVVDDTSAKRVVFNHCDTLDIGGTGGTAVASARVGKEDRTNPKGRSVLFKDCKFSATMNGATVYDATNTALQAGAYRPFDYKGRFEWEGPWEFSGLGRVPDGLSYIDCNIKDSHNVAYKPRSLLHGTTVLSLLNPIGTTPPTITENTLSGQFNPYDVYHTVVFNEAAYKLVSLASLPYGWNTLDVSGMWVSGNPLLVVQLNGGDFAEIVRLQFNGLNDLPRRWRVAFWNPTPQASYRIGLSCQAVGDTCRIHSISCYPGLPKQDQIDSDYELVGALPTPSERWFGTTFIVRSAGVADTASLCVKDAASSFVMRQLTLT